MEYIFDADDDTLMVRSLLLYVKKIEQELDEAKAYISRLESTKDGAFLATKEIIAKRKKELAKDLADVDFAFGKDTPFEVPKIKRRGRLVGSKNKPKGKVK